MNIVDSVGRLFGGNGDIAKERDPIFFLREWVSWDLFQGVPACEVLQGCGRATHLDFRYQPIAEPEETGNGGRVRWVAGRPGEAPAYAGTDFIIARDGRIAALYLFFDKLP